MGSFERVEGYAGGVLVLGADSRPDATENDWHVLLGCDSWGKSRGKYSLFSARGKGNEDLETVVARRFCAETEHLLNEQELCDTLKSDRIRKISIWREKDGKALEYRVYILPVPITTRDIKHVKNGECSCTGCSFNARKADSESPNAGKDALRWQGLNRFLEDAPGPKCAGRRRFSIPVKHDVVDIVGQAIECLRQTNFPNAEVDRPPVEPARSPVGGHRPGPPAAPAA